VSLLTLTWRPSRFADLVGQDTVRAVLQALVFAHDMPAALLFSGPSGTGKTTAARVLAAALNCEHPENGDCCTRCSSCTAIRAGQSTSVHEIDAATSGGVDEIRALKSLVQFATTAEWRVVLLDEAHSLTRQAFNALLKTLEEPPPRTVFVLLTTEPDKIMPTVRSRAMPVEFRPVPAAAVAARLATIQHGEHLALPAPLLTEIAEHADGSVRNAVMLLDQARRVGVTDLAGLRTLTGRSDLPAQIVAALVLHEHAHARALLDEYFTTTADLPALIAGMIADLQQRFANHALPHQRMIAATKLLWDARSIPTHPARLARTQTEALLTLLYAVFHDAPAQSKTPPDPPILRVTAPQPEADPTHRLDLDEVVDLLSAT
jgi:DNA polymerase-3 subunit gamma/tau